MSILARYKKRGGFRQLLELIESSNQEKQDKLLKVIEAEDAHMAGEVRDKILTWEKFCNWKADTICLCIDEMTMQYKVILCKLLPDSKWEEVKPILKIQDLRDIEEQMELNDQAPLPGEAQAAYAALFSRIRELDEERKIVLSMIDPSLKIDEAA